MGAGDRVIRYSLLEILYALKLESILKLGYVVVRFEFQLNSIDLVQGWRNEMKFGMKVSIRVLGKRKKN